MTVEHTTAAIATERKHATNLKKLEAKHVAAQQSTNKKHQAQVKELEIREKLVVEELKVEYYSNVKAAQDFTNDLQAKLLKEEAKRIYAASEIPNRYGMSGR